MLLTKREEQLVKAFLQMGKLSLKEMADILQVSSRTVYRLLSDLALSLEQEGVQLIKDGKKYYLIGDLSNVEAVQVTEELQPEQRLLLMTYYLLMQDNAIINEELQEKFLVSNVTVIQDIAQIEKRLVDFGLKMERKKGYRLVGSPSHKRRLLAILLSNAISIQEFWQDEYADFPILEKAKIQLARQVFEKHQHLLGEVDPKLRQFLIILLALADNQQELESAINVSKAALDFSKQVFEELAKISKHFYNLQEIVYFATILDEVMIKRQEVPLFREKFDSEFYYSISQLVDAVSRFTKIDFIKDKMLFNLLFNHIRLSLAVPILFPEFATTNVAYLAAQKNQFLHSIVSLVMRDIFPAFIQNEFEYELVTLHFASSLRRSPDIYPIRLLLITDERPLTTSVLLSRIKNVAPFVEMIAVKSTTEWGQIDLGQYDYWLTTRPLPQAQIDLVSTFPTTQEMLELQEKLQDIQENRTVSIREEVESSRSYDLQMYLRASSHLLQQFRFLKLNNTASFEETVAELVAELDFVENQDYLIAKLLSRFALSPLAIPNTNLALLHTQSSKVTQSQFVVVELVRSVSAISMNHQSEEVKRILVMLTKVDEEQEMRDLMTAISQSIIENNLYTEIYRAGNRDIIYHLLNTIFTENIKKLEN